MIEKRTTIVKTEIVGIYKILQTKDEIRFVDTSGEEEVVVGTQTVHNTYSCDMDLSIVPTELHDLANLLWTQEVKDAWTAAHPVVEREEENTPQPE